MTDPTQLQPKRIYELDAAGDLGPTDLLVLQQGEITAKLLLSALAAFCTPVFASQGDVTAGTIADKVISPLTFKTAMTTAIDAKVAEVLGGAPLALDTLNKLAEALNDDASFAATVTNALAAKLDAATYTAAIAAMNAQITANSTAISALQGLELKQALGLYPLI